MNIVLCDICGVHMTNNRYNAIEAYMVINARIDIISHEHVCNNCTSIYSEAIYKLKEKFEAIKKVNTQLNTGSERS